MGQGIQEICLTQSKRLVLLLGLMFAVVMIFQHFELPYGSVLSSLLPAARVPSLGENNSLEESKSFTSKNVIEKNNSHRQTELPFSSEQNATSNSGYKSTSFAFPPTISSNISKSQTNFNSNSIAPAISVGPKDAIQTPTRDEKKASADTVFPVVSISEMYKLLLQSHSSPHSPPQFSSKVDQELLYAKSQIENAPIVKNNMGLYAPLYRNVSMFKRSYEMMDKMLKVYIYKEGEKPIFHDSILEGIYSCEGWFLKLLEANTKFVTEEPGEGHLFYLPFSSRLLQLTLYKRHSHSRDNLIQYMKNYTDMLIAKYPYWNRTGGVDHFLAACHDWAPAETRGRMLDSIRALCNADLKTGFIIGKDVSIPTTYVHSARNPLQNIGGNPPWERPILAFFAGYMHGPVRPVLLKHWENDPDMKIFTRMPQVKGNKNYIDHMKSSKYCICARGFAVHSPRVVESIFYECVPVIISDNYIPPLFEALNWEAFSVFVLEKDIPNLKKILLSISEDKYLEMVKRVKKVQEHFLWHAEPVKYDLFHMILHSIWYNRVFRINHM